MMIQIVLTTAQFWINIEHFNKIPCIDCQGRFDKLDLFWKRPERSIRGNHPVLSYVQLQIYKISKNIEGSNIVFVLKDQMKKLLKMSFFVSTALLED